MPKFYVVYAFDKEGMTQIRLENRPAHRARLREDNDLIRVHVGGPLLEENGTMMGTMLIVASTCRENVKKFLEGDPYVVAGLYKQISIHEFAWGLGQPPVTQVMAHLLFSQIRSYGAQLGPLNEITVKDKNEIKYE